MLGSVLPFRRPLTAAEAIEIVRGAVGTDKLGWTDHALQQMDDRSISNRIVMTTLAQGSAKTDPVWNADHSDWVCVFQLTASGRNLKVVVGIDLDRRGVSVITSY